MGLMLSRLALKMGLGSQPPLGPRASPDPRRSHCGSLAVPVGLERWWTVEGVGAGGEGRLGDGELANPRALFLPFFCRICWSRALATNPTPLTTIHGV